MRIGIIAHLKYPVADGRLVEVLPDFPVAEEGAVIL
jgi:hypothetical protein